MGSLKEFTFNVNLTVKKVAETEEIALEQLETDLYNANLEADRIDLYDWENISEDEKRARWLDL